MCTSLHLWAFKEQDTGQPKLAVGFARSRRIAASLATAALAAALIAGTAAADLEWQQQAVSGPSPRCENGFAFDTSRNVAVVFGGSSNLSFAAVNRETWEYNGTGWLLVNQAGPSARCDNAMAYDSIRQRVVSTA